ncbi:MAG: cyclic nucleotide-binding domain-containing protein [Chromatiales bacterium]|nr:cyclic nucleotide-binding domain-containing protein [Chromatiales bacterium]
MDNPDLDTLRGFVPFNTLSDEAFARLGDAVTVQTAPPRSVLFNRGDAAPVSIYLLRGYVGFYSGGTEVDAVAAGSPTARFPLAHRIPRELTAKALTTLRYASVNTGKLNKVLEEERLADHKVSEVDPDGADDWMSKTLRSPLFHRISPANIESVLMRMQEFEVADGDRIIRQGDTGDYYYVIKTGRCTVERRSRDDRPMLLATLSEGDSFGEEALLSGARRSTSVTADGPVTLLRLSKDDFVELIKKPIVRFVDAAEAIQRTHKGAHWLDVRETDEPLPEGTEPVAHLPVREIRARANELKRDTPYITICEDGANSTTAAYLLVERGLEAFVLRGGIPALRAFKEEAVQMSVPIADSKSSGQRSKPDGQTTASSPAAAGDSDVIEAGADEIYALIEARLDDSETARRKAEAQVTELRSRLFKFTEQARATTVSRAREDQARIALEALRSEYETLKNEREEIAARAETLDELNTTAGREAAALRAEIETLRAQSVQAGESHAAAIAALESERDRLIESVTAELREQYSQAQRELEQRADELNAAKLDREALEHELEDVARELEANGERNKANAERATQFDAKLTELKRQLEQRSEELTAAKLDHETMQRKLDEAERQRAAANKQAAEAEQRMAQFDAQLAKAKSAEQEAAKRATENEWRVAELTAVVESHVDAIRAAQANSDGDLVKALRAELKLVRDEAREEIEALRRQLTNARLASEPSRWLAS